MNKKRVFSYMSDDSYDYLIKTKANLIFDGFNESSISKIVELGIIELKKNNEYNDVKRLLEENEMIR